MIELPIYPLVGMGLVRFGMSRNEVEALWGPAHEAENRRHLFFGGVFVDYDESGRVEFIEASPLADVAVTLNGTNLQSLGADEAVKFVSGLAPYDHHAPEPGYSFVFPDLQLALWRSAVPETGDPDEHEPFESVAIGRPGYFAPPPN